MKAFCILFCGVLLAGSARAGALYTLTDLGAGSLKAINNEGAILGSDSQGAFVYQNGQKQYLPQPAGGAFYPQALNDAGEVVGYTNFGSSLQYALTTYANGVLTVNTAVLGVDPVGANNGGQITGAMVSSYGSFFYSGGALTTIVSPAGSGGVFARAINSAGTVAGIYPGAAAQQPFTFSNGQFTPIAVPGHADVGGINNSGVIAGTYGLMPGSGLTAGVFVYDATGFHDLGPALGPTDLEDAVKQINNQGLILGLSEPGVGWVWIPGTGFVTLNDLAGPGLGYGVVIPEGFNNEGQIIAERISGSSTDALLLTPAPEPGSALLVISVLIPWFVLFRRHA